MWTAPISQEDWTLVRSDQLEVICPACVVALAHERWPRWVPAALRVPNRCATLRGHYGIYGVSRDLDRSITPSACLLARSVISSNESTGEDLSRADL